MVAIAGRACHLCTTIAMVAVAVRLVPVPASAKAGVQVKTPVVGFRAAPAGRPGLENVRESPSGSLAWSGIRIGRPWLTVRSAGRTRVGTWLPGAIRSVDWPLT